MARIRTIKPEFWADEKIARLPRDARLLFIGLLNFADDEGRLRGNPALVRAQVFPYDLDVDSESLLRALAEASLIVRYTVEDNEQFIWIRHFTRHQKIDRPSPSQLPPPPKGVSSSSARIRREVDEPSLLEGKGRDQGSGNGSGNGKEGETLAAGASPALPPTQAVWKSYATAYRKRHGAEPVRNAKVNGQLASFVKRVGGLEAPEIAAFFVSHHDAFYATKMHPVGLLLADAEKLRTEWVTGKQVTGTKARQAEKTQANVDGWGSMLKGDQHVERR